MALWFLLMIWYLTDQTGNFVSQILPTNFQISSAQNSQVKINYVYQLELNVKHWLQSTRPWIPSRVQREYCNLQMFLILQINLKWSSLRLSLNNQFTWNELKIHCSLLKSKMLRLRDSGFRMRPKSHSHPK